MSGHALGVFGVPGSGKSTLIQRHAQGHPHDSGRVGSSFIKAVIAPASVRDMDKWPPARREAARFEAIRRLEEAKAACEGVLLVDGHFTLRNRGTGSLELAINDADKRFYDAIVLLDADVETILRHTGHDTRSRHGQTPDAVAEHLALERQIAQRTAREMGVTHFVIDDADLDARALALAEIVDRVRAGEL